jgi:hypothetical protein
VLIFLWQTRPGANPGHIIGKVPYTVFFHGFSGAKGGHGAHDGASFLYKCLVKRKRAAALHVLNGVTVLQAHVGLGPGMYQTLVKTHGLDVPGSVSSALPLRGRQDSKHSHNDTDARV